MQANVTSRVTIAAKSATVFEYLANLKYHYLWNPQVQSISSTEKLKKGSTYTTTSLVLGVKISSKNVITKFKPSEEIEISNNTGLVHYRALFELIPSDGKTVVVLSTEVSADSNAFAFAKPILKALARRELQTDLQALKVAVEHHLE